MDSGIVYDQGVNNECFGFVYVRGFGPEYNEKTLKNLFKPFGKIKKSYVVNNESKVFGIVIFYQKDKAEKAIQHFHDNVIDGIKWYAANCEKKLVRDSRFAGKLRTIKQYYLKRNLYIRDFPSTWTEEDLHTVFDQYGKVTSAKIGEKCAFVCYENKEQAAQALDQSKTLNFEGKKLYVTYCEEKSKIIRKIIRSKSKRIPKNPKVF
jgi:polyadenylate-binding protein